MGLVIYSLAAGAILAGMRRYMKYVQRIAIYLSIIGFIIVLGVAVISAPITFPTRFNQYVSPLSGSPNPYQDVINIATSAGYSPSSGF